MAVGGCPAWKDGAMAERDIEKVGYSLTIGEKYHNIPDIEGFSHGRAITPISAYTPEWGIFLQECTIR